MNDTVSAIAILEKIADLKRKSIANIKDADNLESEAKLKRQSAAALMLCAAEFESMLPRESSSHNGSASNPFHGNAGGDHQKLPTRYRQEGATADLVRFLIAKDGAQEEAAIGFLKGKGVVRDTAKKLINRMVDIGDATRTNGRLYFTDDGKKAWKASPLSSSVFD